MTITSDSYAVATDVFIGLNEFYHYQQTYNDFLSFLHIDLATIKCSICKTDNLGSRNDCRHCHAPLEDGYRLAGLRKGQKIWLKL